MPRLKNKTKLVIMLAKQKVDAEIIVTQQKDMKSAALVLGKVADGYIKGIVEKLEVVQGDKVSG